MKKYLASLLCVMMVFCMMPAMAFAEEEAPATSLPEAVGGVITLVKDVELAEAYVVGGSKGEQVLTVNLNGYKISAPADTEGNGIFWVQAGGDLTIEGPGTVDGVGTNNWNMAIWADGGKVTINGGTYTNVGAGTDSHYDLIYTKHGGTVDIYGGTFVCHTPNWTLNQKDHQDDPDIAGGAITVNGGKFYQYNPSVSNTENPIANFVASGYFVSKESASSDYYVVHTHTTCNEGHTYCPATCADTCHVAQHEVVVTPPAGGGYYPVPSVKPDVTPEEDVTTPEEGAQNPFEGVEKFKARSAMTTLNGKPAIKISWNVPEGVDYDGFEVFRSTKRFSGFGTKPFWTTTKTSYTNNKGLEEGKTYYYKVRAFKVVDGEKVYSDWSYKAWRTVE